MRFLPYLLVLAMALPIAIWFGVSRFAIQGQAHAFSTADLTVLGSLGCVMVLAFVLLSRWMHRSMVQTGA